MLITAEQLQEIRQIIADHHEALIVDVLGPEAVTPEQLKRLVDQGLASPGAAVQVDSAVDAYVFGQLLALAAQKKAAGWSLEQLHAHLRRNPVALTEAELQAVTLARERAGQYIRGLGNRAQTDTGVLLIEADARLRARMVGQVQDLTARSLARRETARQLKSDLGWATGDWTRDWDRIARTEQQQAIREGQADALLRRYGAGVLVARVPQPDACQHCRRLHLGPDGQPRIFPLSVLTQHGTNVGRKAADWQATVGPVHPHCACQTVRVPEGYGFDEFGDLVPGGKFGERYGSEEDLEESLRLEDDLEKGRRAEGRMTYQGIPLYVENPVGSVRRWEDQTGAVGETKMVHAYGYAERTAGADGDEVDVFVGPDPQAPQAFIVEQQDPTGRWDEQKVMLGFLNLEQAEEAYRAHYDRPAEWMLYTTPMPIAHLKRWLAQPPTATTPAEQRGVRLVVPLGKAWTAEYAHTRAHMRAPGPGLGVNWLPGELPPRPRTPEAVGYAPTARELVGDRPAERPVRRDPGVYDVLEPADRAVHPAETMVTDVALEVYPSGEALTEEAEENMAFVQAEQARQIGRPRPYAHPEDEDEEEEEEDEEGGA